MLVNEAEETPREEEREDIEELVEEEEDPPEEKKVYEEGEDATPEEGEEDGDDEEGGEEEGAEEKKGPTGEEDEETKQEREARRAALDCHHQYLIDFVAFFIDQKPKDVEEFIIDSQEYLNLMDHFFREGGTRSIMFYHQDHEAPGVESGRTGVPTPTVPGAKKEKMKRVMVTNGVDIPMKGLCMHFYRPYTTEQITVKNVSEEYQNTEEPGLVLDALNDMLQIIFLKNLKINTSWVTVPDEDMAYRIKHRFITAVTHYSDFLTDFKNDIAGRLDLKELSNLDEISDTAIKTADDVIAASKKPEIVQKIEHTVILWCKNIERVLAMSKQMRKETDNMAELAYWRNLMAKMCYIFQQTQENQLINMIQVLMHAKSRVLRRWKDVDSRVSDEYHESRDNVRYMYALEKSLYEYDPPGMIEHISSMMYTIRTIHTTSRYYNTCEKITALMVKISNQMVAGCKRYLTIDETLAVWNHESAVIVEKLHKCIELYQTYRGAYEATKTELQTNADGRHFDVSVNHIFGRFEKFCDRLKKIIQVEEIFKLYGPVHESNIYGLEDISARLKNIRKNIQMKTNADPLDFRNPEFDADFVVIRNAIDDIQADLEKFMDRTIEACPTAMHGLRLLERFQNLRNRCLDIDGKLWYLFQFYHNEIMLIQQIYEAEKNETPAPRGYPPFAGKITWARHLYRRLERPMKWFHEKTDVLQREGAMHTIKLFNSVGKKLIFYEILFHESWVTQCNNSIYDALEAPILALRGSTRQELVLNFDPAFFRRIIEETEIIRKMELEVPDIAQVVYCKRDKLYATYERIKGLLERFLSMKTEIPQDLSVLMRPIVKKVEKAFMPGVTNINWTSFKTDEYFNYIEARQNELEEVINKVQEIISLRINQVLFDISHTMLLDIPDDHPVIPAEFMEGVHRYGQVVGQDLEYKSRVCERAVAELINNLLQSRDLYVTDDPANTWLASSGPPPIPEDVKDKDKGKDKALVDPTLTPAQMTNKEMFHIYEECRHVFGFYNQKCIEALQKTTRISLDILRGRTEEPQVSKRNPGKILNKVPLLIAELVLTIPTITLRPTLQDMQQVLIRGIQAICDCLKRIILWGQSRKFSFSAEQDSSFYKAPEQESKVGRLQHADDYLRTSMMKFIEDCRKELQIPIKDMNDLYAVMSTLTKIRENIFKNDSMIQPVEENYNFLQKQKYFVPEEERDRAFALRKHFTNLLSKSIEVLKRICADQHKNKAILVDLVSKFQQDLRAYMERYDSKGPMKEGLIVDQATERLYTFQDEFDNLWERYTMCNSGEKLFGLQRNQYPELGRVKQELSLLQKLYSLYNDVLRTLSSYSEFRWKDVDMVKVTDDMNHFKIRAMRLPRGLKEWPVYKTLYKKIEELHEWCPVGELMSNKGMKDSHWESMTKVTGLKFDVNNCNFTLKAVMEAASVILKFRTEIEEICHEDKKGTETAHFCVYPKFSWNVPALGGLRGGQDNSAPAVTPQKILRDHLINRVNNLIKSQNRICDLLHTKLIAGAKNRIISYQDNILRTHDFKKRPVYRMEDGIIKLYYSAEAMRISPQSPLFKNLEYQDFQTQLKSLHDGMTNFPVAYFCSRKLIALKTQYNMYLTAPKDDQEKLAKFSEGLAMADTHVHAASCLPGEPMINFMKESRDGESLRNTVIDMPDGRKVPLHEWFNLVELNDKNMTMETILPHHRDLMWRNFQIFKQNFNIFNKAEARRIFMKYSTAPSGVLFRELIKRALLPGQVYEFRLPIRGLKSGEWLEVATWASEFHDNQIRWIIQFSRTVDGADSFESQLKNFFFPLFDAIINPDGHPEINAFLLNVVGVDLVDEEAKKDYDFLWNIKKFPADFRGGEGEQAPPYSYFLFYFYANLSSLNYLISARGNRPLSLRPHGGEAGSLEHLAACFLLTQSIAHGWLAKLSPVIQYLFYLSQIGLSLSLRSNNFLYCKYVNHPIKDFLHKGLNCTLSSDDPLIFHDTCNPLLEEYLTAKREMALSDIDLLELSRNGLLICDFPNESKEKWLGEGYQRPGSEGNVFEKTQIPDKLMQYRFLELDSHLTGIIEST